MFKSFARGVLFIASAALFSSCASISVRDAGVANGGRPTRKPAHFYVAPFSVAGADIRENAMRKKNGELGTEAQALLTKYLVAEIARNLGPATAVRSANSAPRDGWLVSGEFVRLSEGNRLLRMGIGLGVGGTKMETRAAVRNLPPGNPPFLRFTTTGGSNAAPGAATNPIPFSSAASALTQSTQGVTDDAARTARMIVATTAEYMVQRGWLAPGKVAKPKRAR